MSTITAPTITAALRIPDRRVTRQTLEAFTSYMRGLGAEEADVYVDYEDDAIVLEACQNPGPDETQEG